MSAGAGPARRGAKQSHHPLQTSRADPRSRGLRLAFGLVLLMGLSNCGERTAAPQHWSGLARSGERFASPAPSPTPSPEASGQGHSDPEGAADPAFVAALARVAQYPRFGDHDPHDWQGLSPRAYPVHGIDVARYQGEIDWRRVARAGVSFAYIKATEGGDVIDPRFAQNWRGAADAGLARGAYHYYYFCRSPEAQARWFIRNVPKDAHALPPVLDMEWNHRSETCKRRPHGAEVRREVARFLRLIRAHYGQDPVLYTTVDFYRETGIGELGGVQFWLRSVADHPRRTYPGRSWIFWQYTGTGEVEGVAGPVDINVFARSAAEWLRWRQATSAQ